MPSTAETGAQMFAPRFSAVDAVAVTSSAHGVLTLGFADPAVISAFWDLSEQVPLSLACLLDDPVVPQGSDLLLLLRSGHRAAEAKLRSAHFALWECLCGGSAPRHAIAFHLLPRVQTAFRSTCPCYQSLPCGL